VKSCATYQKTYINAAVLQLVLPAIWFSQRWDNRGEIGRCNAK